MISRRARLSATDRSQETNTTSTASSPAASGAVGCAVSWRARLCVVAGVLAVAGLGSPGAARAASPAGGGALGAEIQLALAQLGDAVPSARGFASANGSTGVNIPSTVLWGMPAAADGAITTSVAAAAASAATAPFDPGSTWTGSEGSPSTPASTGSSGQERGAEKSGQPERAQGSASRTAPRSSLGHISTVVPQSSGVPLRKRLVTDGLGQARAAHRARAKPERPAGAVPQRLPPRPLPPRPDMTSSGQAGGQGQAAPLLLVALAATLSLFGLRFLPRALPLPALRKPRHTVIPSWKPG